ncbi:chymotrypsin-1 isoform X12 [Spodoptera frugiperda]|uniref:Chymotrypsin-1 isoform X12 n=1 Tax=Spodoptera frugiperda TaxID=7108 RepID=A0A9R0DUW9_SPOFR|nr:chymotrypsin-1 isoform X12 [Spodoptera frugiperda]
MYKLFLFLAIAVYSVRAYKLEEASRIAGGSVRNDINYVISLQKKESTPTYERGHKCGGVLITRQNALTAASCVFEDGQLINQTYYRVFAGTVLTNDNADSVRDIASITVHPDYNSQTSANDIAIITLQNAFPDAIKPLPMPTGELPDHSVCESSGFGGLNASSTASAHLMTLPLIGVLPNSACNQMPGMQVTSSMICGMGVTGGSGCSGDLGNPLVCTENPLNPPSVLAGLLSIKNNCAISSPPNPEVYTRVSSFAPWVNQVVTGGASTSQLGIAVALMFLAIQSLQMFD